MKDRALLSFADHLLDESACTKLASVAPPWLGVHGWNAAGDGHGRRRVGAEDLDGAAPSGRFVELDVVVRRSFADLRSAYPNGCRRQRLQVPARSLRTAHGDLAETWRIGRPFNSSSGSVIAVELSGREEGPIPQPCEKSGARRSAPRLRPWFRRDEETPHLIAAHNASRKVDWARVHLALRFLTR